MEIFLTGHEYRYAVEQMLFTLYPGEKPVYPAAPTGSDRVEVHMRRGGVFTTAVCRLTLAGATARGEARVRTAALTTEMITDRLLQRIVKLSFYRAALAAGHPTPQWGALTGVRPGKLMTSLLREGCSERQAFGGLNGNLTYPPAGPLSRWPRPRPPWPPGILWRAGTYVYTSASPSAPPAAPTAASSAWRRPRSWIG